MYFLRIENLITHGTDIHMNRCVMGNGKGYLLDREVHWEAQKRSYQVLKSILVEHVSLNFFSCLFIFERETECKRGKGRERGRHRIQSRLQAMSCQHRAQRGARTHRPRDRDLSRSRMLHRLSHPGVPNLATLKFQPLTQTSPSTPDSCIQFFHVHLH